MIPAGPLLHAAPLPRRHAECAVKMEDVHTQLRWPLLDLVCCLAPASLAAVGLSAAGRSVAAVTPCVLAALSPLSVLLIVPSRLCTKLLLPRASSKRPICEWRLATAQPCLRAAPRPARYD